MAGPVLFLLFLITGTLIGPGQAAGEGETIFEKARELKRRTRDLAKAELLLGEAESYLGLGGVSNEDVPLPDPRVVWADLLEPLPAGVYSWREVDGGAVSPTRELRLNASFHQIHQFMAGIDGMSSCFTVKKMSMWNDGNNTELILIVSVSGTEGGGE